MTHDVLNHFALGMLMVGYAVAGAFFLRFWSRTRDRFFLLFAIAFFVFALNQVHFLMGSSEDHLAYFGVRLLGFLLLLAAIIDKNRPR
jgi:hypothetical protein